MAKTPATTSRPRKTAAAPASHDNHGHGSPAVNSDGTASDMDYEAHESTYEFFTGFVKWGIIAIVVLVIFLFVVIHPMIVPPAS